MEEADLVIIGAGIFGMSSATTYHRLHPTAKILLIDSSPSIGGPWAPHRIFPGLRTNNLLGMYEHPDFPMDEARFGVKKGEHVPAEKMLEYLEALVEWSGIGGFLRLGTRAEIIEKETEGWKLQCRRRTATAEDAFEIRTKQLIITVGNTNKPFLPQYSKEDGFKPLVIHSKDFPAQFERIVKPATHTLVVGSGKSAWDIAYACATQPDSTVTMLIRPSGNGPIWMPPPHVTPFGLWLEKLVFTRFFGFMSPCPWAETSGIEGWLRSFLQGTWLGRKIVSAFWQILGDDVHSLNKLNEHSETKKLRPWTDAFEVGNTLSIHNYPTSFFDLVRNGRIKVVIDEVQSFSEGSKVLLQSGATFDVDAVVSATGWRIGNTFKLQLTELDKELGMPSTHIDSADAALIKKTEQDLLAQFPTLDRNTSRVHHPDPSLRTTREVKEDLQPYRLHRFIAPPALLQDRSVAFAGALHTLGTFPCAYIQSLWITAYLDGTLALPSASAEQIRAETYRNTQYCVLRHTFGYGRVSPDLVWDSLPYFDMLLKDLGFMGKRKGGWFGVRECVKSYGPEDYRGLLEEWERRQDGAGKKDV